MSPRIDPRLGKFARAMRSEPTTPEAILWKRLRGAQCGGHKFRRQAAPEQYIVDFFCPAKGLIVELDGRTHEVTPDTRRDAALLAHGFATLRFSNLEIARNLDGVLITIFHALAGRADRWPDLPYPPAPSPEGEGEQKSPASHEEPSSMPSPSGEGRRDARNARSRGAGGAE